jgi:hypothetical protein
MSDEGVPGPIRQTRRGPVYRQGAGEDPVFRTEKRRHPQTGHTYPWIVRSSPMVNHFYCYCMDRDFGPFFAHRDGYTDRSYKVERADFDEQKELPIVAQGGLMFCC